MPNDPTLDQSLQRPIDHPMRQFATGAIRDNSTDKPEYFGYTSWRAMKQFGAYMLKHQKQADGQMRAADNWKKGIPLEVYQQSLTRHFVDWAAELEKAESSPETAMDLALAMKFNLDGWIHEMDKQMEASKVDWSLTPEQEKGAKIAGTLMPSGTYTIFSDGATLQGEDADAFWEEPPAY